MIVNNAKLAADVGAELSTLTNELNDARIKYAEGIDTGMSDEVYDQKYRRLLNLERTHPFFTRPDSPTKNVGTPIVRGTKHEHSAPLLSLGNVFNYEELADWMVGLNSRYGSQELAIDYKMDGLALSLTYIKGHLKIATTRGDGKVGEVVTPVTTGMTSIKQFIKELENVDLAEIHGEIMLPTSELVKLNDVAEVSGSKPYSNARNAAAGLVRTKSTLTPNPLVFIPYGATENVYSAFGIYTHVELMNAFKPYFHAVEWLGSKIYTGEDIEEVSGRATGPDNEFGIDGRVIKVNDVTKRAAIGFTTHEPRWAIAYKFTALAAVTKLKGVTWQVGRTGRLTPVAELEPVGISGSIISRVTLHNMDEIRRLGLTIGVDVHVAKRGDVIPKVMGVVDVNLIGEEIVFPTSCPCCDTKLEYEDLGDELGCVNRTCKDKQVQNVLYFVSRPVMNIDGIGEAVASKLVELKLIDQPMDLLYLTKQHFVGVTESEVLGSKIFDNVTAARTMPLNKFINGLCVPYIGKTASKLLAEYFGDVKSMIQYAIFADTTKIEGIGPVVANIWKRLWISNLPKIAAYAATLTITDMPKKVTDGTLSGKTFVITGSFEGVNRDTIKSNIESVGGKVSSGVSKTTDFLVAGDNAGSKLDKAGKLGVKVITYADLLKLM